MNRLMYLFAKNKSLLVNVSEFVDILLREKRSEVNCLIVNKATGQNYFWGGLTSQNIKSLLQIKCVSDALSKEFNDELSVFNETKSTLAEMQFLLENKNNINPENKKLLLEIFNLVAEKKSCHILNGCILKISTSCNKPAKPGYDLHFQIYITDPNLGILSNYNFTPSSNNNTITPNFSPIETLSFLHECVLKHKDEVLTNVRNEIILSSIKTTSRLTKYNRLKNKYLTFTQAENTK